VSNLESFDSEERAEKRTIAEARSERDAKDKLTASRKEVKELKRDLIRTTDELNALHGEFEQLVSITAPREVPEWLEPKRKPKQHAATPWLMLSDLHLDEVVDAEEMLMMNAFDRGIAEQRFERVINGTSYVADNYLAGLEWDGIVVALGGDIITGVIHEELAETNDATVPESIVYWSPIIAAGLKRLADTFGKVHVPCVDGNHDRFHAKIRYKKRAVSSMAWIIYNSIALLCKDDDRITFAIPKASEQIVPIYDMKFLLNHGDNFRSQGGIGGIYPSMLKWVGRKRQVMNFDMAVIGHWHQLTWDSNVSVNGSLKGYDEYAKGNGFGWERPQQMLFVVTPENGITFKTSVFANSQTRADVPDKKEGWS
jgi:predicted phosphodiesterase